MKVNFKKYECLVIEIEFFRKLNKGEIIIVIRNIFN